MLERNVVCTRPAVVLTVLADAELVKTKSKSAEKSSRQADTEHTCPRRICTWIAPNKRRYRDARRYSPGVMPVARRKARVKLVCEENWESRAIFPSDVRPAAIRALALSSRRWLT